MEAAATVSPGQRARALALSTVAMAVCFAVWVIFSIIGVELQRELGFSQTAFGLLVATPILTGSLSRVLLGIWSELFGGRRVYTVLMLVVAACAFVLPHARSYPMLLLIGLGLGLAGGSFSVGVVYVTAWYPQERHGTALGLFGMGNAGASVTSFAAPFLLAVMDWRQAATVYAVAMLAMALVFWFASQEDPATRARRAAGAPVPSIAERLAPLRNLQVWRFSIYYFLVFGGFIALTSWLPRYYVGAYELDIRVAGMLTASFAFTAAVFRAVGGALADRYGARTMMYVAFSVSLVCLFLLSYPDTHYIVRGIRGPLEFTIAPGPGQRAAVLFVLGFVMALGMAAVFKHIPTYYPRHVGSVGGVVGMIGGLGGFFLPIAFGLMNDLIGVWTGCFMLLFAIAGTNLLWMHFAIRRMERRHFPQIGTETDLPEIMDAAAADRAAATRPQRG
ncbi:MAG: MFS transporter [Burkholderiales bacterium]